MRGPACLLDRWSRPAGLCLASAGRSRFEFLESYGGQRSCVLCNPTREPATGTRVSKTWQIAKEHKAHRVNLGMIARSMLEVARIAVQRKSSHCQGPRKQQCDCHTSGGRRISTSQVDSNHASETNIILFVLVQQMPCALWPRLRPTHHMKRMPARPGRPAAVEASVHRSGEA